MKLQYLHNGSADCPLIRLYEFTPGEVMKLKEMFDSLALGSHTNLQLHRQAFIEPVDRCQLDLRLATSDVGILQTAPGSFTGALTQGAWADVAGLTDPLCGRFEPNTYQWLNEDGPVSLLLSHSGTW